ncbi:class II fructose-bisphosphate aldolase [Pelosinus fermentans]|uniref:Ketose-bisphosphate aldolase n=1 Tax=Pelosinus fermentans JBW45 TaxID=1192197 RepID=I8U290_9FIRM|nr:class II fructose-bisphosphate aldolase [Pelosinus fermentans]AJQ27859.1 ketose-bisphosphate aldolase [Pelosinus fermentans JBW45]
MALVTMNHLLDDARNRKYAVGGFNVFNLETLCAVVEVAEELKTPLVLGITERFFKFVDVETLSAAMVRAAQKSSVPIALHLDHGHTYEGIIKAIRWGFTSVMFDGSALPVSENLKQTREVTRIAHSLGVSVEGELGYVGCCEHVEDINEDNIVTCDVAADFVDKTKVDALAVSVGNKHGAYRGMTKLNITRLGQLSTVVSVPLVMHGGSKLSSDDYSNSIKCGISKINIPIDTSMAASEKLKNELRDNPGANYIFLMSAVKKGVKESVSKYMFHFNCISKAL